MDSPSPSLPAVQATDSCSDLNTAERDEESMATNGTEERSATNGSPSYLRLPGSRGAAAAAATHILCNGDDDEEEEDEDDDKEEEGEGCSTPRSSESQIPEAHDCPPAPKKRKAELGANGHELVSKRLKASVATFTAAAQDPWPYSLATTKGRTATANKKSKKRRNPMVFFPDFDPSHMFLLCT